MKLIFRFTFFLMFALLFQPFVMGQKAKKKKVSKKDYVITLSTMFGDMFLVLYEDTPKHRENFLKLAEEGFYDSTTFHRVMKNFMIQGGDPNTKPGGDMSKAGRGGPGYRVDAEILSKYKHLKGTLAAARQSDRVNPEKKSSGSQFYIVHNKNGTPHLDGGYSVFGTVIKGIDVIDKVAAQQVNPRNNRPETNVYMTMTVKKMKKKKITKIYGYEYPM